MVHGAPCYVYLEGPGLVYMGAGHLVRAPDLDSPVVRAGSKELCFVGTPGDAVYYLAVPLYFGEQVAVQTRPYADVGIFGATENERLVNATIDRLQDVVLLEVARILLDFFINCETPAVDSRLLHRNIHEQVRTIFGKGDCSHVIINLYS